MSADAYRVYKLSARCEELMQHIRLRNIEWSALFSMNGQRSLYELGRMLELQAGEINEIASLLEQHGLIEEEAISFEQYIQNTGKGPEAQKSVSAEDFLNQGRLGVPPQNPPVVPVRPGIKLPPLPQPKVAIPSPQSPPHKPLLFLRALIDFIVGQAPSSTEGQLAVYRVFLRVPPELLKKNGIVSLSLVEDQTAVDDPDLQSALAKAVEQTLHLALPPSVFG